MLPRAEQLGRVVHHGRRCDRDLCREPQVPAAEPAGPEHVLAGNQPPFEPQEQEDQRRDQREYTSSEPQRIAVRSGASVGHHFKTDCWGAG